MKRYFLFITAAAVVAGCAGPLLHSYKFTGDQDAYVFEVRKSGTITTDATLYINGAPVDTVRNLTTFGKLSGESVKDWNGRRLKFYAAVDWWDGALTYQVTVNDILVAQNMK